MDTVEKRVAKSEGGLLDLSALGLSVVPQKSIAGVRRIRHVNLSRNHFIDLEDVEAFAKVVGLDLSHNHITAVPECLPKLSSLESLDMSCNKIFGEPSEALLVASLVMLDLSNNRLATLRADISSLVNLRELNLSHNELVSLPPSIGALPALTSLNVSDNRLRRLPAQIGDIKPLFRLDVSYNKLTHLPPTICGLEELKELLTSGNPWVCPSASICDAGHSAIVTELGRLSGAHADPLYTSVSGLANCISGQVLSFVVLARDSSNASRIAGGDDIEVHIKGPAKCKARVTDSGDGTYLVEANPSAPGVYTVRATVGGLLIGMGPIKFRVLPAEDQGYTVEELDAVSVEGEAYLDAFKIGRNGSTAAFSELSKLSRELNVPLTVPEVVLCGERGYEAFAELLWGIYPLDFAATAALKRPVVLNLVHNSECKDPRLTLRRDRLLGANVSGGMRDMSVTLEALGEMLDQRVHEASALPVNLIYESASVVTCNLIFAPYIPEASAPNYLLAEETLLDLITPPHRSVICVAPSTSWTLFQNSQWLSRILAADSSLSRTAFAFTQFSSLVGSFTNPRELEEFIRGKPAAYNAFFTTLVPAAIRASCATAEDYKRRLWQTAQLDNRALELLMFDKRLEACLGAQSLRAHVHRRIVRQYHSELPLLQHSLANLDGSAARQLALVKEQMEALGSPALPCQLRLSVSNFTLRFSAAIAQLLRGSVEGARADLSQTFEEEVLDMQSRAPLFFTATNDVDNASCRLYGGAQLVRALENFKQAAQAVNMTTSIAAEGVGASGSISVACQLAQRDVRSSLSPLIDQLCSQASYLVERTAQIVEVLLSPPKGVANQAFIDRVVEFSYLPKNVKELFMEIVEQRIAAFKTKCYEDFTASTTLWDMPALTADGAGTDMQHLAEGVHAQLRDRVTESVCMRFYNILLQGIATQVPTEMHLALMGLQDKHLANFFQLSALEENLRFSAEKLEAQMESYATKKAAIRAIVL